MLGVAMVEGMDVSAALTGGSLRAILGNYPYYQPEALDVSAALTGGVLLIATHYQNYPFYMPEAISVTAALTGGSLA